jgi:hypothetical protein
MNLSYERTVLPHLPMLNLSNVTEVIQCSSTEDVWSLLLAKQKLKNGSGQFDLNEKNFLLISSPFVYGFMNKM